MMAFLCGTCGYEIGIAEGVRAENDRLRAENARLQQENAELRETLKGVGRGVSWILLHHCTLLSEVPREHVEAFMRADAVLDKTGERDG